VADTGQARDAVSRYRWKAAFCHDYGTLVDIGSMGWARSGVDRLFQSTCGGNGWRIMILEQIAN
jgi:hypothetical protein